MRTAYALISATVLALNFFPQAVNAQSSEVSKGLVFVAPADLTPEDIKAVNEALAKGFSFGSGIQTPFGGGGFQIEIKAADQAGAEAKPLDTTKTASVDVFSIQKNWLCEAACDVTSAAGGASCTGLSSGVAAAACIAAAAAVRDECRRRC